MTRLSSKDATAVTVPIASSEADAGGGFTAIASTASIDRDGEVIAVGAFNPLPATVPVHADHVASVDTIVGRARPRYDAGRLLVDVTLGSGAREQDVRRKIREGLLDSVSIVFIGHRWEIIEGVRTCTAGELLAVDVVTVPSQRDARILGVRSMSTPAADPLASVRALRRLVLAADAEIVQAKAALMLARHATADGTPPLRHASPSTAPPAWDAHVIHALTPNT
ncbi:hypothetical protein [Nocardioides nanhaiensis]|uniref:Uncharacterized protein n=1 Tax=Nocardioides nanhaiensis TaxID=1476871 RepID=A0ABP8X164_9ACTN